MTANDFDLAPAQTAGTTLVDRPQPQPATQTPTKTRNSTKPTAPDTPTDGTLGGVIIPGGALATLIGLCWLTHQFGLPAVILGLIACAAAATTALVLKARAKTRKTPRPRSVLRSTGGAGPGGGRTTLPSPRTPSRHNSTGTGTGSRGGSPSGSPKGSGRLNTHNNGRPTAPAPRSGNAGGTTHRNRPHPGPSAASHKPGGTTPTKTRQTLTPTGKRNTTPNTTRSPLGKAAAALGGTLKPTKNSRQYDKHRKNNKRSDQTGSGKTRRGLLGRTNNTPTPGSGKNNSTTAPKHPKKNKTNTPKNSGHSTTQAGLLGRVLNRKNTPKPVTDKGHHKTRPTHGTPTRPSSPKEIKAAKKLDKAVRNNKGHKGTSPKPADLKTKTKSKKNSSSKTAKPWKNPATNPHRAPIGPARRGTYWIGKKLRKHTSRKTRMRIKKVVSPARRAARTTNRIVSPLLARTWRYGTRTFLHAHMVVGTIRYTNAGPNWIRPIGKLFHILTTPLAKTLAATGSWGWLNRWMYKHTTPLTSHRPAPAAVPTSPATASDSVHQPDHTTVEAPTHTTVQENPVSTEAAAPLEQAAEAVLQAGAMLLTNPAENMVGYEATLHALAVVQHNISTVMRNAAETTRENFKVNPAVAEAYDDSASYAQQLGDRLDEIPGIYYSLHEEQIENIKNPTHQARKWDIAANE